MFAGGEDVEDRAVLDDFSAEHDSDVVGDFGDDAQIVRDEQDCHASTVAEPTEDVEDLCRVYVRRILHVAEVSGLVMTVLACFVLTSLAVLGFGYSIEFAQAVFLLAFPMTLVGLLSLRSARIIRAEDPTGHELYRRLQIHRMSVQFIGMASIFVTTMWGMFKNFSLGVLGG